MGINMRWMRICAAIAAGLLMAACSPEYNWREVSVADEVGRVLFPDKPRTESRTLEFNGHPVLFTLTTAKVGNTLFAVGHAPWPEPMQADDALRRSMGQTVVASLYNNLGHEAPAELPAFGDLFQIDGDSGVRLQARVWLAEHGLVEGMVMGPTDEFSSEAAKEFLDSVALGR